jgi:hypothetical protein
MRSASLGHGQRGPWSDVCTPPFPIGCSAASATCSRRSSGLSSLFRSSRTFATVRHRTKVTRGPGSRAAGLAMAFKLIESAQDRWRAVNAPHLVALVRAGAIFINGKLAERPGEDAPAAAA